MKALEIMMRMPWALTSDALEGMIEIAARENLTPAAVEAKLGRPLDNTHTVTIRDGVATIPVMGPIFRFASLFTEISGATSIETLARDFNAALSNSQVRSIVFQIDSPGGEVNGTSEFAGMIYEARGQKPITAYISDLGCSAAYWIASACDSIVVADTATVGSIGVVAAMRKPNAEKDTSVQFVSSQSPDKRPDIGTEKGRATIQKLVDSLADVFVSSVARNRGVSTDTVLSDFGQGGVMIGQEAVTAGLADAVGTYEGTLSAATQQTQNALGYAALSAWPSQTTPLTDGARAMTTTPLADVRPIDLTSIPVTRYQTFPYPAVGSPAADSNPADSPQEQTTMSDPTTDTTAADEVAELKAQLAAAQQERDTVAAERDQAAIDRDRVTAEAAQHAERIADLERKDTRRELTALATGWYGATEEHVTFMEGLPTPEARTFYVTQQNALAEQLKSSELFKQTGVAGAEHEDSAFARLDGMAKAKAKEDGISYDAALQKVVQDDPSLYAAYRQTVTN